MLTNRALSLARSTAFRASLVIRPDWMPEPGDVIFIAESTKERSRANRPVGIVRFVQLGIVGVTIPGGKTRREQRDLAECRPSALEIADVCLDAWAYAGMKHKGN